MVLINKMLWHFFCAVFFFIVGATSLHASNGTLAWSGYGAKARNSSESSQSAPNRAAHGSTQTRSADRAPFLASPKQGLMPARAASPWFGQARSHMLPHSSPDRRSTRFRSQSRALSRRFGAPLTAQVITALTAHPPADFSDLTALGCIAVSIYHEARNQPAAGQYAVGSVILTRAATPERWGDTPCAVVQPVQFSYLSPDRRFAPITDHRAWAMAVDVAAQVLADGPAPALKGADHYHATYVWPRWNQHMTAIGRIADHVFWRSAAQRSNRAP